MTAKTYFPSIQGKAQDFLGLAQSTKRESLVEE